MASIIQLRRDTAANWTSANPTLGQGEAGYETDTGKFKIGDGSTAWTSLAYLDAAIDRDSLAGFVADEHVAHSGVSINAGTMLSGGGTIAATRTINLDPFASGGQLLVGGAGGSPTALPKGTDGYVLRTNSAIFGVETEWVDPDGLDADAIHDNVSGEIAGVTEKTTPVSADLILIEDSAASNAKKRVQIGNLPGGGGGEANTGSNQGTDGVGVFDAKAGVDLQFRHVAPASSKVSVALNGKDIDLDVVEANINHDNLAGFAADEHVASGAAETLANKNVTATTNRHRHTKGITIESPTDSEDITCFFTDRAITLAQVRAVLRGSASPSVTYQIKHSTDRSAAGNNGTTSAAVTSTTTGTDATLSDATIPANSWVWLETTAQSGTVDEMAVFFEFTDD